jgi:hypothetical protein
MILIFVRFYHTGASEFAREADSFEQLILRQAGDVAFAIQIQKYSSIP